MDQTKLKSTQLNSTQLNGVSALCCFIIFPREVKDQTTAAMNSFISNHSTLKVCTNYYKNTPNLKIFTGGYSLTSQTRGLAPTSN